MTPTERSHTPGGAPLTPAAIICGIEQGGTTLLLDMLKGHPRVYARFEIGLLVAESLSCEHILACQPYTKMLCNAHSLSAADLRRVAQAPDWMAADIIDPEEEQEIVDRMGPLRWTLYPAAQRLQQMDVTPFGDPLPQLPAFTARRLKRLSERDHAA